MALGKKFLLSLSVFAIRLRKRLPDGSRVNRPVFPTHRLYLGILTAAQVYLVTHFCYLLHFFFLSTRDNETIRDRLTRGKSPLARRVSHCSFCVLRNCRHSHRQALSLYLQRAATISTARCHQLPRLTHKSVTLAQYLATFRPFWQLFSPQQVHTDKPSDFFG